ncbi:DUF2853 family protein [Cucumibacter marinus]|uniref:DUF2853 family protein n=1 Tax=Cucumibacter marinus TaxID=1121252 RepID=UPI000403DEB8|nr:DUF2853 family protein [Cucumibacter marinus]
MNKYLTRVRQYDELADEKVVKNLERYLGIALRSPDSRYVAASSAAELELVKRNFLKKKLGLKEPNGALDDIVGSVAQQMRDRRMKCRLTFYYLCAKRADRLSVFS